MVPLYIDNDTVQVMAERLAREQGTTVTEAIRRALQRQLEIVAEGRERRDHELRRLFAAFEAHPPRQSFGDPEMYDEDGLPR